MSWWTCPGCGAVYSQDDPDLITRHVGGCDYTDGAGQEIDVTIKFSAICWYLAAVTGGLPFADLRGQVEDGYQDEVTEDAVSEFLTGLIETAALDPAGPVIDGLDVGDVYDARRDDAKRR